MSIWETIDAIEMTDEEEYYLNDHKGIKRIAREISMAQKLSKDHARCSPIDVNIESSSAPYVVIVLNMRMAERPLRSRSMRSSDTYAPS